MRTASMLIEVPDEEAFLDGLTVDDVLAIPERPGLRLELHEGALRMAPPPHPVHQKASFRLAVYFDRIGRDVYPEIGIRFDDRHYRIPDLSVLRPGAVVSEDYVQSPEILGIVVEFMSRGSVDEDQLVKPKLYAQAGIPEFWRAERVGDDWSVLMHRLRGDRYVRARTVLLSELIREAP